jgi:hypothetical protein
MTGSPAHLIHLQKDGVFIAVDADLNDLLNITGLFTFSPQSVP